MVSLPSHQARTYFAGTVRARAGLPSAAMGESMLELLKAGK